MPTGYTDMIKDDTGFADWAAECARAFGALVMMRDEPTGAKIPERFEPSNYHKDALASVHAERLELARLTDVEINAKQVAAAERTRHDNAMSEEKRRALAARYARMRALVEGWRPPTSEHEGLKKFMLKQIDSSIKFDCQPYATEVPALLPAHEWRAAKERKLQEDIEYHSKKWHEEVERTESRNKWIADLRASLKAYGR